jgi:VWFA-related protein
MHVRNTILMMFAATLLRPQSFPAPSSDVPLIRSTTRLVQINVIAVGKDGRPVTDLTKEDFVVAEEGKRQTIALFNVNDVGTRTASSLKLPDNVFSNHLGDGSGMPPSVTAILLDGINTEGSDGVYARRQVVRFLKQIHPEDRIALFSLDTTLRVLHDFTTDSRQLVALLNSEGGNIGLERGGSQVKTLDQLKAETGIDDPVMLAMMARSSQLEAVFATESRVVRTLKAVEAIAEHLAAAPGRKNLIWVSGYFPAWARFDAGEENTLPKEWRSFSEELTRTARALNHANVAVYPVDARGLMTNPGFSAEAHVAPSISGWMPQNIDTMNELASSTGGRAFYNTNDVQGSVRRAIEDSRSTYTIGYYPSHVEVEGKYRTIDVKVNRRGVTVRHRRGYTASKSELLTDITADGKMRQALWRPLDSTAISMNARVDRAKGSNVLDVVVQISTTAVTMEMSNNLWQSDLAIAFIQNDSHGKQVSGVRENIGLKLPKDQYLATLRTGILYRRMIPLPAEAVTLKVAVVDKPTGGTGTVTVPLSRVVEHNARQPASGPPLGVVRSSDSLP